MPSTDHRHGDDDLHDLGLLHDLRRLDVDLGRPVDGPTTAPAAASALGRRRALAVLAGGAGALALAACGRGGSGASGTTSTSSTSTSATSAAALGATSTTTAGDGSSVTSEIPDETGGPFPADGSNGPNVLTESGVVRSDLTTSFGPYSGSVTGVPLALDLTLVHAGTGRPYAGAAVYLWHADPLGRYSLYSQGTTDQSWLRGVQASDAEGRLAFRSVFPGAYDGRWPHIHFEVYDSLAGATRASGRVKTSQMAMPAAACDVAYATSGYGTSASNLQRTSLARDMVFSDGYSLQLPTVTGDARGMTATLAIAV